MVAGTRRDDHKCRILDAYLPIIHQISPTHTIINYRGRPMSIVYLRPQIPKKNRSSAERSNLKKKKKRCLSILKQIVVCSEKHFKYHKWTLPYSGKTINWSGNVKEFSQAFFVVTLKILSLMRSITVLNISPRVYPWLTFKPPPSSSCILQGPGYSWQLTAHKESWGRDSRVRECKVTLLTPYHYISLTLSVSRRYHSVTDYNAHVLVVTSNRTWGGG